MILTAVQTTQPDYVALAMVLALAVSVLILAVRKRMREKAPPAAEVVVEAAPAPEAPGSAGQIRLCGVEPKTAAMVMAIVADKMGKPLNELRFISIKEVE
ncbi:MAG: hypothetical protein IJO88_03375 [Oscillospiraceae bacterium]|nr:hypothetical protein [Oscillospiraceae bacterium]